jgi:hypothetical protein
MAKPTIRDTRLARERDNIYGPINRTGPHPREVIANAVQGIARTYAVDVSLLDDQFARLALVLDHAVSKMDGLPHYAADAVRSAIELVRASLGSSPMGNVAWCNREKDFAFRMAGLARQAYGAPWWSDDDLREIGRKVAVAHLGYEELAAASSSSIESSLDDLKASLPQFVYFIGCGITGPVKIGIAADPNIRLATLQTGHFDDLHLLAVTRGGREGEVAYHRKFAEFKLKGEWFTRSPAIETEIARIMAQEAV